MTSSVARIRCVSLIILVFSDVLQSVNSLLVLQTLSAEPVNIKDSVIVLKATVEIQRIEKDVSSLPKINVNLMLSVERRKCAAAL